MAHLPQSTLIVDRSRTVWPNSQVQQRVLPTPRELVRGSASAVGELDSVLIRERRNVLLFLFARSLHKSYGGDKEKYREKSRGNLIRHHQGELRTDQCSGNTR